MGNSVKGDVEFEVGGKKYSLRFSTNVMCQLEELTGKGFITLTNELMDPGKMTMKNIRLVLWAALRQPDLTVEQVGDLMDEVGEELPALLQKAYERAAPPPDSSTRPTSEGNQRPQNGTGSPSSPSGSERVAG